MRRKSLCGHSDSVNSLCLVEQDSILCSASSDQTIALWDLRYSNHPAQKMRLDQPILAISNGNLLWAGGESAIFAVDPRYLGNPVFVNEISEECGGLSAMDNFCAAAEDSGRICVYRDSECVAEYQAHDNLCGGIKMVKDDEGMCVLSGGFDSKIVLWDPLQQAVIQEISVQSQQSFNPPFVHSVEMCLEADTAVAALGDGSILLWIWDDEEEDTLLRIPAHRAAISHIHFAHWGNQYELISLGNDKRICFWNMQELNHDESSSGLPLTPNFEFEHTAGKPHWSISHPYHRNLWVCDESCEISMYL